jgi:DNA polymerase I-like protein with 3'-5' exonuclease and polymerase domains
MIPFDFETLGIESRPNYPPVPVGVAIGNGKGQRYIAWGHPADNNAGICDGIDTLQGIWDSELLCHNAAFDLAVACERLGLKLPEGAQINDTMIMAFLLEPYGELSLKPLAERYLGMPPAERDAVRDWLKANYKLPSGRAPTDKQCGAYIAQAPGSIVGPYACGDVERTVKLYEHLKQRLETRGLWSAYRRECEIMPMLLDNSAQGIPLDYKSLRADTTHYESVLAGVEANLRSLWKHEIGSVPPINFDSGDELAEALSRNKRIKLPLTKTGKLSTAKEALMGALPDGKVKGLLLYRSALNQCLTMYMRPWVAHGSALHCNWNQVRDFSDYGARTGRISSSPNMQNTTNPEKYDELLEYMRSQRLTSKSFTLPNLRNYLVAPKGHVLFSRDYSQ